jgi:hypothetical protein
MHSHLWRDKAGMTATINRAVGANGWNSEQANVSLNTGPPLIDERLTIDPAVGTERFLVRQSAEVGDLPWASTLPVNKRIVIATETPAQSGRAFNSTY